MEYAGFTHTRWTARVSHYSRETTRPLDRLQGMGSAVQTSDQATGKAGGHTHSRDGEGIPRAVSESRPTRGLMSVPPHLSIARIDEIRRFRQCKLDLTHSSPTVIFFTDHSVLAERHTVGSDAFNNQPANGTTIIRNSRS